MELQPVQVSIKSFQSIDVLNFEVFGFTAITGRSNIGKSSIMRAISRSIMNDPVVNLVRKGEKFVTVELKSDKWGYKWEKGEGNGVNHYEIGDRFLDKTGQVQLPEIKEMGFGSIRIGDDDIHPWWASQFDPIFLLNKSGPQVTDFITEISGLKTLQNAIVHAARFKKRNNDIVKIKTEEVKKTKDKQFRISDIEKLDTAASQLDEQIESIEAYEKRVRELGSYVEILKNISNGIDRLSDVQTIRIPKLDADVKINVEKISKMHDHWLKLENSAKLIIPIKGIKVITIPEIPNADNILKMISYSVIPKLQQSVKILESVDKTHVPVISQVGNEINKLKSKQNHFMSISDVQATVKYLEKVLEIRNIEELPEFKIRKMYDHSRSIKSAKKLVEQSEIELKSVNKILDSISQELSQIPTCPSCSRPIIKNHDSH